MKTPMHALAGILFFTAALALPAQAADRREDGRERLKAALNTVVQDVREAGNPAAKRAVLDKFLAKAERNARLLGALPGVNEEKQAGLKVFRERFAGYSAQLHGQAGQEKVADGELDSFASFLQQDLEQAESSWGGGGIYLSAGAIIIILLILILIT